MNFADKCQDLNKRGVCEGNCCGPMPMDRQFIMEHYGDTDPEITFSISEVPDSNAVIPIVDFDDRCIFLNREKHACRIYDDRPEVCKRFGDESHPLLSCPHMDAKTVTRSRQQRRSLQRRLSKAMDGYMKRQKGNRQ